MRDRDQRTRDGLTAATQRSEESADSDFCEGSPRIRSSALLGGSSCLVIEHGREEYRLRITRLGKLILTK